METNGPSLIIMHIEQCTRTGEKVDVQFIKEVAYITSIYMPLVAMSPDIKWHEVRTDLLKDMPYRSKRWGE